MNISDPVLITSGCGRYVTKLTPCKGGARLSGDLWRARSLAGVIFSSPLDLALAFQGLAYAEAAASLDFAPRTATQRHHERRAVWYAKVADAVEGSALVGEVFA